MFPIILDLKKATSQCLRAPMTNRVKYCVIGCCCVEHHLPAEQMCLAAAANYRISTQYQAQVSYCHVSHKHKKIPLFYLSIDR